MLLGLWEVLVHMIFDRCDGFEFLTLAFLSSLSVPVERSC